MPNLFNILNKSYKYSKNHIFLWFFGFFLTGGGIINFIRYFEFGSEHTKKTIFDFLRFVQAHPGYFTIITASFAVSLLVFFIVGAVSRAALLESTLDLEDKKEISFRKVLNRSARFVWRVLAISFIANALMFLAAIWLAIPVFYVFYSKGTVFWGVVLALAAGAIALPLFIIFSLVNIFASCFVVAYDMHFKPAIKSAFDLFAKHWDSAIALLILLASVYFILFLISASALSLFGLLAFALSLLLKSLSVSVYIGVMGSIITILIFALLIVNAALNAFTNISWTLYFMEVVKSENLPYKTYKPVEQHRRAVKTA